VFLVRIASAQYRWHAQKPFYALRLSILEPQQFKECEITSRLYCTPKAMWKLGWFLRDFIYDPESLSQGVQLLGRFVQDGRVKIRRPKSHQQIQFTRTLSSGSGFVAFVDAIGELDGTACLLEWKTSSARYPEQPTGLTALDPQLICYSWMTGIDEVAQVVFVRKRAVEVQYLRATITDEQRQEFETLVEDTVRGIESDLFLAHSGIRFPQNPCTACPFLGICLNRSELIETALVRKPGVDLGLFDELAY
jgi:hypothetical protein